MVEVGTWVGSDGCLGGHVGIRPSVRPEKAVAVVSQGSAWNAEVETEALLWIWQVDEGSLRIESRIMQLVS